MINFDHAFAHGQSYDLTSLNDLLALRHYNKIIESDLLFLQLFFRTIVRDTLTTRWIKASITGKQLTIGAGGHCTPLSQMILAIRLIALTAMQKRVPVKFHLVEWASALLLIQEPVPDEVHLNNIKNGCSDMAKDCLLKGLPSALQDIGLCASTGSGTIRSTSVISSTPSIVFKISPDPKAHDSYRILPKRVVKTDMRAMMYDLYQKQELCDLSLKTSSGAVVNIHALILYTHGGPILQKLKLPCPSIAMNETKELLLDFADFLYMIPEEFEEKINQAIKEQKKTVDDLAALFKFAHKYEIGELIDICTNLFARRCSQNDYKMLQELADQYENAHLQEFCRSFSPMEDDEKSSGGPYGPPPSPSPPGGAKPLSARAARQSNL
jgi:hypothetical protein